MYDVSSSDEDDDPNDNDSGSSFEFWADKSNKYRRAFSDLKRKLFVRHHSKAKSKFCWVVNGGCGPAFTTSDKLYAFFLEHNLILADYRNNVNILADNNEFSSSDESDGSDIPDEHGWGFDVPKDDWEFESLSDDEPMAILLPSSSHDESLSDYEAMDIPLPSSSDDESDMTLANNIPDPYPYLDEDAMSNEVSYHYSDESPDMSECSAQSSGMSGPMPGDGLSISSSNDADDELDNFCNPMSISSSNNADGELDNYSLDSGVISGASGDLSSEDILHLHYVDEVRRTLHIRPAPRNKLKYCWEPISCGVGPYFSSKEELYLEFVKRNLNLVDFKTLDHL
jgi:hypothetical protein